MAIVCYSAGQFGGVWAAMQLRMTLAELSITGIPSVLPVTRVQESFSLPATRPALANQVLAQIELWANHGEYKNKAYVLPKHLDEKVAALHFDKLGVKLTALSTAQGDYLGLRFAGPSSPSTTGTEAPCWAGRSSLTPMARRDTTLTI